jgi:signal transduction histidine kinase
VLGVVAHDLRNPLGTILVQAQELRRRGGELDTPVLKASDRIETAARRMKRLIQDLLDVSRVEAGKLALERAVVQTRELVAEAVEAQSALAAASSIELRLEAAADLPDVLADRDRLRQVFENLIGNALKFTPPGGRVTVGGVLRAGGVLFYVRDTGPGIATEDQPQLFDRFWQARRSRADWRGGAGLGLQIVKGIVEAHGGCVWVESAAGEGATFYFTLPAESGPPAFPSDGGPPSTRRYDAS